MIPVYEPYFTGLEKEYVNQCLDSTWISSKGPFITRFEQAFADYTKASYATTVSNGTVALHLALETLGLMPGDEVIVPTLTYVASVNTIIQTGAKPIYVDSVEPTCQMDVRDVSKKITSRTKAIMAVHLYGLPCDMDALTQLCADHQLYLIEDCAEGFGTYYKGKHVGTFGDIATFSFFGNKTITTGEGGMILAQSKSLIDKVCHLKNQGVSSTREYWHDVLGYNYRMTNICAAIGLAQLERADEILNKKRELALWYKEGLTGLPVMTHDEIEDTRHSFWMCSIILNNPEQQSSLRAFLKAAGVETRPFFHPAHTLPHCESPGDFPVATSLSSRGINLPSSPLLSYVDVARICEVIHSFFKVGTLY
jgi:perosamine synthetase